MWNSREQQGEIRPSSINNANKQRKTREWETEEKTGNIKGTFHTRMGTIKDRNGKDLTEAEKIKRTW